MSSSPRTVAPALITGEELLAMGDIGSCELIDGRIVPMSPTGGQHGAIEAALAAALIAFVKPRKLGRVLTGEVGIYTRRGPDRVRGADVVFLSKQRFPGAPSKKYLTEAPDLVVEILSPDDRWQDMQQKIEEYFAAGVGRVWVVEPDNRALRVYRSGTEMTKLGEADVLRGDGILEGFTLPIADLFAENG